MSTYLCEECGLSTDLPEGVLYFTCRCKSRAEPIDPEFSAAVKICATCKFRSSKGCGLFLRPCSIGKLWRQEIPPPEQCPNGKQFPSYEGD